MITIVSSDVGDEDAGDAAVSIANILGKFEQNLGQFGGNLDKIWLKFD